MDKKSSRKSFNSKAERSSSVAMFMIAILRFRRRAEDYHVSGDRYKSFNELFDINDMGGIYPTKNLVPIRSRRG